eukprot:scaffold34635_cov146-Skeletonema_dohrnii-CCMP3373.AAC.1
MADNNGNTTATASVGIGVGDIEQGKIAVSENTQAQKGAMEQFEAARSFNSAEAEYPTASAPPLDIIEQQDSLTDAKQKVAAETQIAAYNSQNEASAAAASSSSAPSIEIPHAYVVDPPKEGRSDDGGRDTVYSATPLEPELPWWKERRSKVFLAIIFALVTVVAAGVGYAFSRPAGTASSPTVCFADGKELKAVVSRYVRDGCGALALCPASIVETYGWPMREWCVDDVTNMASLFEGLDSFDEDISGWNVGQVSDMNRMFYGASKFNQDLSKWNMSSVTNTREMFKGATSFNQDLCAWKDDFPYSSATDIFEDSGCTIESDPSSVDQYQGPFCASSCNVGFTTRDELKAAVDKYVQGDWGTDENSKYGPIRSWHVEDITDMSGLFEGLDTFNEDISGWNVGQVTNMYRMFSGASSFNQDLSRWNVGQVTRMREMFDAASSFDGDISSWNTAAVTDMSLMFWGASKFNQDLSKWNTSAVTDMNQMFSFASSFNQDLSRWNTSAVRATRGMFYGASSFDGNISSWNTAAVTNMHAMFMEASSFDGNISSWNTAAVTDISLMFKGASSFNQDLCAWKDNFPYSYAGTGSIFEDSGCVFKGTPQVQQGGPFCASECINT